MIKKILLTSFIIFLFWGGHVLAAEIDTDKEMLLLDPEIEAQMSLDIDFLFCEDSKCGKEKKDFYVEEPFFINYKSDNKLPIKANFTLKNSDFEDNISIPGYYTFPEAGEYEVNFHIDINKFKDFDYKRVINVTADEGITEENNIDLDQENKSNLVQTSDESLEKKQSNILGKLISAIIVLLVFIIFIFVVIHFRKNKNKDISFDNHD
jgi:hypothetical protein